MKTLYPYQRAAIERFLSTPWPHRLVLPFPTGSGKTACSIAALRQSAGDSGVSKVLVICPAPVRSAWKREFHTWWPELQDSDVAIINVGPTAKMPSKPAVARRDAAYAAPIRIASPELASHLVASYDFIILDEMHLFRRSTSKQSKTAAALMENNPNTPALGLTATQIPNDVKDLWHPLHLLWNGKWGKPSKAPYEGSWQFNNRYSLKRTTKYGTEWYGLNPEYADELREKLNRACYYVSREDIAPYRPKPDPRRWEIGPDVDRVQAIQDWCDDALREGTHVSIQVYERKSAKNLGKILARKFGKTHKIFTISGEQAPEQRNKIWEQWVSASKGILVSAMMSFGIGIRLNKADRALIAELWYVPGDLEQLIGRYVAADGKPATPIDILIRSGSPEERIAEIVIQKAQNIDKVTDGNQVTAALTIALDTPILNDDELATMANDLLLKWDAESEDLLND